MVLMSRTNGMRRSLTGSCHFVLGSCLDLPFEPGAIRSASDIMCFTHVPRTQWRRYERELAIEVSDYPLVFAPVNEAGVLYLFGALSERLGFLVLRVQAEFPDCEAMRLVGEGRMQMVRIEFEYESRNFLKHAHDPSGCDLIV
jgi:hypothetical protein